MNAPSNGMRTAFLAQQDNLEDFWARRTNRPRFERRLFLFGHELHVASNQQTVLQAVDLAAKSYSRAEPQGRGFSMTIIVDPRIQGESAPAARLPTEISYVGAESWLSLGIGGWGRAHVDLDAAEAVLIVGQQLAGDTVVLARWVLHTIWTNFLISSGYGMVHATALHRDGSLLCFVAPHNSGKSTTAIRLAVHRGFRLLSDSLLFVDGSPSNLRFNAFPVGRVSLREDGLDELPELAELARPEAIRSEIKYDIDLARLAPELVEQEAVHPERILLFLLERHHKPETLQSPADPNHLREVLVTNSMFYDTGKVWTDNLAWLEALVQEATAARLLIGTDRDGLLEAIDRATGGTP